MKKKLYKSTTDKYLTGVLGGIAEYLNTDPTVVRIVYSTLTVFTGVLPGVINYIVCSVIIPDPPFTVE